MNFLRREKIKFKNYEISEILRKLLLKQKKSIKRTKRRDLISLLKTIKYKKFINVLNKRFINNKHKKFLFKHKKKVIKKIIKKVKKNRKKTKLKIRKKEDNLIQYPIISKYKYIKSYSFYHKLAFNNFLIAKSKMSTSLHFEIVPVFPALLSIKTFLQIILNLNTIKNKSIIHIYIEKPNLFLYIKHLFYIFNLDNILIYNSIYNIPTKTNKNIKELFLIIGDFSLELYNKIQKLNYNLIYSINFDESINSRLLTNIYFLQNKFNTTQKAFIFFTIFYKFLTYSSKKINKKPTKKIKIKLSNTTNTTKLNNDMITRRLKYIKELIKISLQKKKKNKQKKNKQENKQKNQNQNKHKKKNQNNKNKSDKDKEKNNLKSKINNKNKNKKKKQNKNQQNQNQNKINKKNNERTHTKTKKV